MAIPTITNNSPSAGNIAWGSFTIRYQNVDYLISAGSTPQRWVWWRFNGGVSSVIEAGPDIPTNLTDDDLVLFGNKNGIGLRVQATSIVDGELIVDGSIFSDAIATNQINSNHIVTAGLDAGVIKFGVMSGDRISVGTLDGNVVKAGTLLASQLVVTDLENNLDNPVAQLGTVGAAAPGWAGTVPGWFAVVPTIASATLPDGSTGPVLQMSANGTSVVAINQRAIIVKPGDQLWISGYMRKVSGTDATGNVFPIGTVTTIQGGTLDTTTQPTNMSVDISTLTAGSWISVEGVYTVPTSGIKTQFYMNIGANVADGVYQFWGLEVRRKNNGKLIVDGSIDALQLDANSVASAVIQTGLLQAQLTITGILSIEGGNSYWSTDGLFVGNQIKLYGDSRTNQIEGDLVTSSLSVKDGLSVGGNADLHGTFSMTNGITTPTAKMSLGQTWPKIASTTMGDGTADNLGFWCGMYDYNSTSFLMALAFFGCYLRKVNKTTGAWDGDIALGSWKDTFYPTGGIAVIGGTTGNAYTIGHDQSKGDETYLIRINLNTGAQTASWRVGGLDPFHGVQPRVITDGTNVGMIWTTTAGTMWLRWYNPGLTAVVGSDVSLMTGLAIQNVGGAYWGPHDPGGQSRLFVTTYSGDSQLIRCWSATPTAPVRVTTSDFVRASSATVLGLCYDANLQRMRSYDKGGALYTYSNYTQPYVLSAKYTWYDGDTTSSPGSTAHETAPSPINTFNMSARAFPTISAPPAPDELVTDAAQIDKANRIGIYASIQDIVQPSPRLITYLPVGRRALDPAIEATDPLPISGIQAGFSTVPSFATALVPSPGRFRSAGTDASSAALIDLYGSGAGRVGPYRWDANGKPLGFWNYSSTATQSIASGSFVVKAGWATRDGPHMTAVGISYSAGVVTIAQAGIWLISAAVTVNAVAGNRRHITAIFVNGANYARAENSAGYAAPDLTNCVTTLVYLNAGDQVDVRAYQVNATTPGAQTLVGADQENYWSVYCLAAY